MFRKKKLQIQPTNLSNISNEILHQRGNIDCSFPSDFSADERKNIEFVKAFTMTSYQRLVTLSRSIQYIEEFNIEGDIVECGVWKGGSIMMAALKLIELKSLNRDLFLFDTYEGMTIPTSKDKAINGEYAIDLFNQQDKTNPNNSWCFSPLQEVKKNVYSTNYNKDKIHFIKGKVEDTLPHDSIRKVAILRLDTDWYESTLHELETLYDKVVNGGIIIIDDYGHWSGCKKAVDEFIRKRNLKIFLNRIDYSGRLLIKNSL